MKHTELLVQLLVGRLRMVQTPLGDIEGNALATLVGDSPNKFQALALLTVEASEKLHFFVDDNVRAENVIASIVAATILADPITATSGTIEGDNQSFLCYLYATHEKLGEPYISLWTRGVACGFLLLFPHMIIRSDLDIKENSFKVPGVIAGKPAKQFIEDISDHFARALGWGGVKPAGSQLSGIISSMIVNWMKGINWCSQLAEEILIQSKKVKLSKFGIQILSEMTDRIWHSYDISDKMNLLLLGAHSPAKNG